MIPETRRRPEFRSKRKAVCHQKLSHTEISSVDEFADSGLLYARANTWCKSGFDAGSPGEAEDTCADDGDENITDRGFLQICR
ncbi:hypothetical protein L1987_02096 [Smallanthus sonchifolius]|uniref:Uncharacterized protein n=1 Tax=Smallanthus sonchifolius TaxID=185202 RepID=A0ACB9K6V9_9ASTR|nr:hypothetical protein L1987_02096 [Smallanthus sonchifolius]